MGNTGRKKFSILIEYSGSTNTPTGVVKPNISTDPDYVAPVVDYISCPITTTTTTTIANRAISIVFPDDMFTLEILLKKGLDIEFSRSTEGSWTVPNYIYDSILFDIADVNYDYNVTVYYADGKEMFFDIPNGVIWKVLLEDMFSKITQIVITKY